MSPETKQKNPAIQQLKAATFDLLTQRGKLETQVQAINQTIQAKISELRKLEVIEDAKGKANSDRNNKSNKPLG